MNLNWNWSWKRADRLVAGAVFLYALVLYLLTVAPTASFWDAGEYIAAVQGLQVSHPPGAPFYMLVGHLFTLFAPASYVALSVNLVSVLASALTVLLAHLVIVRLVRWWQPPRGEQSAAQRIAALAGGVIGATAFAATDSFWFNAVETEVYALSMFFTAMVVWLVMRWSTEARAEEARLRGGSARGGRLSSSTGGLFGLSSNRYLVLIAYLFGLAIGVHLLNLLALFFVALIVFFTAYDRPSWSDKTRWAWIVGAGAISALVFFVIYPGIIQLLPTMAGASGVPFLFFLGVFAAAAFAVYYTHSRHRPAWNLVALCLTMVLVGYSTYALIFIRSAADPPIDLNDPETAEEFVSYLNREQYGATPLLFGPTYNDATGRVDPEGEETFLPRRWSWQPQHLRVYARYNSDWEFFWEYQVGHMYLRYFLWNFSGRASDVQDAPALTWFNTASTAPPEDAQLTPSEEAARNNYFMLPLLLGLLGAAYHFTRDWRRAFSVLILFLVTGLGIIVYLNQTPLQPRERDYSYVGSFFAFSLWIGIGAAGVLELITDGLRRRLSSTALRGSLLGAGALLFLSVPFLMASENYFDHDRSGNYVAPLYAYNMLNSTAPNAILFTNGDNDTYPLWYLQEVEGVRPDVRVVNLSLLRTPWYIQQLKHQQARTSAPLPITLEDEEIEQLPGQAGLWEPQAVQLPVDERALIRDTTLHLAPAENDTIESPMTWRLSGRPYGPQANVLFTNDLAAYHILRTNAENDWERPIYFAVTTGRDGQLDLQDYFLLEGLAFRVVPVRHDLRLGRVAAPITYPRMMDFRLTNLDDPDVYYNETARTMLNYYRTWFAHAAQGLARQGHPELARNLLEKLHEGMPFDTIPGTEQTLLMMARAYEAAGLPERAVDLMQRVEPMVLRQLRGAATQQGLDYAVRYVQMIRFTYLDAGAYDEAAALSQALADALNDPSMAQTPEEIRRGYEAADSLPSPAPLDE